MGLDARYEVRVTSTEEVATWRAPSWELECECNSHYGEVGCAREPACFTANMTITNRSGSIFIILILYMPSFDQYV